MGLSRCHLIRPKIAKRMLKRTLQITDVQNEIKGPWCTKAFGGKELGHIAYVSLEKILDIRRSIQGERLQFIEVLWSQGVEPDHH